MTLRGAGGEAGTPSCAESRCLTMAKSVANNERSVGEVRFLTVAEVATLMRVSRMTVYRLVHSGELPAAQIGRSYRVPEQAVHDYLRQSYLGTG